MLTKWKEGLIHKYYSRIREKAISRAKARIALSGRAIDDFSEDELEVIVKEEEDAFKSEIMKATGFAALLVLGLS